jgi:hypothetical protein
VQVVAVIRKAGSGHGRLLAHPVRPRLLGGEPLGFFEAAQGFADLPSHGVCLGEVDVVPCLPFCRQLSGIDAVGEVQGLLGIAQLDGHCHSMQGHVGGTEVVAVLADALGDLPGLVQVLMSLCAVIVARCCDGQHQVKSPA